MTLVHVLFCASFGLLTHPIPQGNVDLKEVACGTHWLNIIRGGKWGGGGGGQGRLLGVHVEIAEGLDLIAALSSISTRALENLLFNSDHCLVFS